MYIRENIYLPLIEVEQRNITKLVTVLLEPFNSTLAFGPAHPQQDRDKWKTHQTFPQEPKVQRAWLSMIYEVYSNMAEFLWVKKKSPFIGIY